MLRAAADPVSRKVFEQLSTARARLAYLRASFNSDIQRKLQLLPYETFLQTTYWIIIRDYLFSARPHVCDRCGRHGPLVIHHTTYEHHGLEHEHLADLVFLCRECHQSEHRPIDEGIKKMLEKLVTKKSFPHPAPPVENPLYDPRTLLNLQYYGDIRGNVHE